MAISRMYIGSDMQALTNFLTSTGLFNSVILDNSIITCKDISNNVLLTITATQSFKWAVTAYVDSEHYHMHEYESTYVTYGYNCENGAFIVFSQTGNTDISVVLSKTNNNKVAVVMPDSYSNRNVLYSVAFGDTYPIRSYTISPSVSEQTMLSPFITNAATGISSYTPNAFYIPFGEYVGRGYAKFIMGGKYYMTDGYFAVYDGITQS